jgi:hypothetical protein
MPTTSLPATFPPWYGPAFDKGVFPPRSLIASSSPVQSTVLLKNNNNLVRERQPPQATHSTHSTKYNFLSLFLSLSQSFIKFSFHCRQTSKLSPSSAARLRIPSCTEVCRLFLLLRLRLHPPCNLCAAPSLQPLCCTLPPTRVFLTINCLS